MYNLIGIELILSCNFNKNADFARVNEFENSISDCRGSLYDIVNRMKFYSVISEYWQSVINYNFARLLYFQIDPK